MNFSRHKNVRKHEHLIKSVVLSTSALKEIKMSYSMTTTKQKKKKIQKVI